MKPYFSLLALFLVLQVSFAKAAERYDSELVTKNAYKVLLKVGPESHPEFMPETLEKSEFHMLRAERGGIVDFYYNSSTNKFQGNLYCHLSQLIYFNEKVSNPREVCFRLNIYEKDATGINGFGKQVGIY